MTADLREVVVSGELSDRIRVYRSVSGLSQDQLAEKASVSQTQVSVLERGAADAPSWKIVRRLELALGLEEGTLISGYNGS